MEINDQQTVGIIGFGVLVIAIIWFVNTRRFVKTASITTGLVVGYGRNDSSTAGEVSLTAVISFVVGNKTYTFNALIASKNEFFLGRQVGVLYDQEDPFHACLDSVTHLYFFEIVFSIVGICMLFVAYAGF